MVDVLLIYPPYSWPNKSHPLGLAYIASVLEQDGFTVKIIDMSPVDMPVGDLRNILVEDKPRVAGISFMTPQYNHVVEILKLVKEVDKEIKTIAGGSHVSALPRETLNIKELDFVVIGEGEVTAKELIHKLLGNSDRKLTDIAGLAFIQDERVVLTEPRQLIPDLNSLPFPAWHLLPMDKYSLENLGGQRDEPVYSLLSSRGCPNNCIFCSSSVIFKRKFRQRSVANIIAEIEFLKDRYNATQFDFVDDTVTVNKKRMEYLCDYLISNQKDVRWLCNSRVNTVSFELLRKMYKAGCRKVDFGVESGNTDILKNIKKGITLEQVINAHRWAKRAGLIISSFFMVGNLGETTEHMRQTADFIDKLETDYVAATISTPFPGTELYSIADANGWIYERDWSKYNTTAFISRNYKPIATNGIMNREQLLDAYFFINSKILKKKLTKKYGKYYLFNYRFYQQQLFARIKRIGFIPVLKLILKVNTKYSPDRALIDEKAEVQEIVDEVFRDKDKITVLEAGCGSVSHVKTGSNAYVVGIDISAQQLERNIYLHDKIVGDIQSYPLPDSAYDLIICWNVLEHLPHPDKALANFAAAVKDGGLIVLRLPNVLSTEVMITKCTPQSFHVWVQRHLFGRKMLGTNERGPFKTYLKFSIRLSALRKFALENDLLVRRCCIFTRCRGNKLKETHPVLYVLYMLFAFSLHILSFSTIHATNTGCLAVFQKPRKS